jgi:hypothetical protein
MVRILIANVIAGVMLLSQVGLPLHMHYCKGMLESVSVFISADCEEHIVKEKTSPIGECCVKDLVSDCSSEKDGCCDDQVQIITQDITLVSPHLSEWTELTVYFNPLPILIPVDDSVSQFSNANLFQGADSGPPIYLMQHALIFYG